jgi:hypothetical protein
MLSFGTFFVEVTVEVGIAPFFFDFWYPVAQV